MKILIFLFYFISLLISNNIKLENENSKYFNDIFEGGKVYHVTNKKKYSNLINEIFLFYKVIFIFFILIFFLIYKYRFKKFKNLKRKEKQYSENNLFEKRTLFIKKLKKIPLLFVKNKRNDKLEEEIIDVSVIDEKNNFDKMYDYNVDINQILSKYLLEKKLLTYNKNSFRKYNIIKSEKNIFLRGYLFLETLEIDYFKRIE